MKNSFFLKAFHIISLYVLFTMALPIAAQDIPEASPDILVREGYTISIAEATISKPRFLEFDDKGTLYVSLPKAGEIKACFDENGDGYYEKVETFVSGHPTAHGMDWHDGWLWFSETGTILRARDTDGDGVADEKVTVIPKGELPSGGGHWWRPVLIHNGRIYTEIGNSGNISDESDTERMKVWSFNLEGGDKKLFASGLRNTEKLITRPGTDEIWGMDHGSDWFGREIEGKRNPLGQPITDWNPPCEMNKLVEGGYYGHPFIVGKKLPRYEYMDREDIVALAKKTIIPEWETGAHWAPNAMCFYDGDQFPDEVKGDAFVAYHGSWNRSEKAGYCVTRVLFDDGHPYGELKYANFLRENDRMLARPVDVVVAPDGSLLISDDWGDKIFRLSYTGEK
ncbi:MAG: PQQ-dependent sugar dehydrogenase [Candidatus Sumerlaeia bacterium]